MGSTQILEEWQYYKYVIDETNIKEKTLWLDVRGNHGERNKHFSYNAYTIIKQTKKRKFTLQIYLSIFR